MRMPADHQIGASIGEGSCGDPLTGLGTMGVLSSPMREDHDDINPAVECSDVGGDPSQLQAIQRSSTGWHVQAIGAGAAAGCRRCLANGVDSQETNPYAVSLDDHRTTGSGQVSAGTDRLNS